MGWWKVSFWRLDKDGKKTTELEDVDLEHIAKLIQEGYTEGEINDAETS